MNKTSKGDGIGMGIFVDLSGSVLRADLIGSSSAPLEMEYP